MNISTAKFGNTELTGSITQVDESFEQVFDEYF